MEATCVRFYEFGRPEDVLVVEKRVIPPPLSGEVLVRMLHRPINPSDLIPIKGAYSHRISLPTIPGYEGVGIVEEVGASVPKELLGRRVLPLRGEGTWQEYVRTAVDWAVLVPDSILDSTAAQLYINPLTAWLSISETLTLKPFDVVVVNACGSSIGRIFAQLCKINGIHLIAVTRDDKYNAELLELGASNVINTTVQPLYETIMEITNGLGVTAAIDSIGGKDGTQLAFCIKPGGVLLSIGLLSGVPVDWQAISKKTNVQVRLFHLRHWNAQVSPSLWQEAFYQLIQFIEQKNLNLMMPAHHYQLKDIKEAISTVTSSNGNMGKVFLTSQRK
ncbi:zinc-dependent alcohol dehydrogenase family protein [Peribacillus alkalitolerans]|uniref:zinc-dependent alcohol dehydrogenase family protein n=1 Tax=Peribacillus alkalitolerans TaxID=1550385 RepID=UPI0013D81E55|nr:zinc-dependent alcohol dehydrogenase family protein [Peribacillus alkalitolerans]